MFVKVITGPAEYPVTLAETKTYLRAPSSTAEDALISSMIISATRTFEQETGRTVASSTLELTVNKFPAVICLQEPPVQSITSIKYDDVDGNEQTLSSSDYVLDNSSDRRGLIYPAVNATWPVTQSGAVNTVRVRYIAGYASAADVPDEIKLWILAHIATWFDNREADSDRQMMRQPALEGIVKNYRLVSL